MSRALPPALALLGALLLAACGGGGEGNPGSVEGHGEQKLNSYTTSDQQRPVAAGNGRDRAVVVWESLGQDGSQFGIYGRRVQNGRPVGEEFRANSYTTGRQSFPAVGMDGAGNFVVAWRSSLQTSPGGNIFGQRYAADGSARGGEFQIGPDDSDLDSQSEPQVAMNERGDTVIAWSNRELDELATQLGRNDLETRFIQFRTYLPDGSPRSGIVTATESADDGSPRAPRVGITADGRVVLAWVNGTQIRLRHFDADGVALSPAYNVNTTGPDVAADLASLAVTPGGAFAVAWEAFTYGNVPLGIQLQRYSAPQTPVGGPATVASPGEGLIERCSLTATVAGDYLLAAQAEDRSSLAQLSGEGALRRLGRVSNSAFPGLFPSVAASGSGKATVAWQSFGQDGDGRGIYVRELSLQ